MSKLAHSNQETMDEIGAAHTFESLGFVEAFGLVVKQRREAKGWTQEELSKHWGRLRTTIANIETGRQSPTFEGGLKLMSILGITMKDVVHTRDYMLL